MEPGQHPFEALELAVADETGFTGEGLLAALEANPTEAIAIPTTNMTLLRDMRPFWIDRSGLVVPDATSPTRP